MGDPIICRVKYGASPPLGKPATSMLAPVWPPVDSGQIPGDIRNRSAVLFGFASLICSASAATIE